MRPSSKTIVERGALIVLPLLASSLIAFRRNQDVWAPMAALACVALPAVYLVARRSRASARRRQTEDRLMSHTRSYLETEEPLCYFPARSCSLPTLPVQDFRPFAGNVQALPRLYATLVLRRRRLASGTPKMPQPVRLQLDRMPQEVA